MFVVKPTHPLVLPINPIYSTTLSHANPPSDTAISNYKFRGIYFNITAPCIDINPYAPPSRVSTASDQIHKSSTTCNLGFPQLLSWDRHIITSSNNNLIVIGKMCDQYFKVLSEKHTVTVFACGNFILLRGWIEPIRDKLWRFSLRPEDHLPIKCKSTPTALNDYDPPIAKSLVQYIHVAAGISVKPTWMASIKAGNSNSWPGLAYANASK